MTACQSSGTATTSNDEAAPTATGRGRCGQMPGHTGDQHRHHRPGRPDLIAQNQKAGDDGNSDQSQERKPDVSSGRDADRSAANQAKPDGHQPPQARQPFGCCEVDDGERTERGHEPDVLSPSQREQQQRNGNSQAGFEADPPAPRAVVKLEK